MKLYTKELDHPERGDQDVPLTEFADDVRKTSKDGFLVYIIWRYAHRWWLKIALTLLCVFVILGIGLSRIYLGVHYPSDIVAGYQGGLFWAAFCIVTFNILSMIRKHKQPYHEPV